jgi:flagellar motor component MotA
MKEKLKILLILFAFLSIIAGFLGEHDHTVFLWHHIPFMDAVVGGVGTLLLMFLIKVVAAFTSKKEDFYD